MNSTKMYIPQEARVMQRPTSIGVLMSDNELCKVLRFKTRKIWICSRDYWLTSIDDSFGKHLQYHSSTNGGCLSEFLDFTTNSPDTGDLEGPDRENECKNRVSCFARGSCDSVEVRGCFVIDLWSAMSVGNDWLLPNLKSNKHKRSQRGQRVGERNFLKLAFRYPKALASKWKKKLPEKCS